MVTVYTRPNCVHCDATKRALTNEGIDFDVVDLVEHPDQLKKVKDDWGFTQAPVVETDEDVWSGHRMDRIKSIAKDS